MAAAPKGICAGSVGIGVYHRFCRDDAYHRSPWHGPQLLVDHCRQCAFVRRLRDPVVWSAKVRRQERPHRAGAGRVLLWIVACSIGPIYARPEARATVMVNRNCLYLARRLRTVARTWRRRVALACHSAAPRPCRPPSSASNRHHLANSEAIAAASDHLRSQVFPLLEIAHRSSTVLMVLRIDAACRIGRVSIFAQTAHPSRQKLGS